MTVASRGAPCAAAALLLLCGISPASAQGNDSPSISAASEGAAQIMAGAGTTAETTTGSSGPQKPAGDPPTVQPVVAAGCDLIGDDTARAICLSARPGTEP